MVINDAIMDNIMLDLECLGTKESGVIVSIGAVYFDLAQGLLGDEYYVEMSEFAINEQIEYGRTMDVSTIIWWMQQDSSARRVLYPNLNTKYSNSSILDGFSMFCKDDSKVWGNGVDFDNTLLRSYFQSFKWPCPFKYRNNRCYRTFKATYGNRAKMKRVGTHHNGLDDAKSQAQHLIDMYKALNKK